VLPITCVVPAFNREALLGRALASVHSQSRPPSQVIVVDDGSADGTAEVAAAYGAEVVRHEVNRGLAAARNSGVEAASQPWVALLDSDDEWLPHHLEALWRLRDAHVLVAAATFACGAGFKRFGGPVSRDPVVVSSPATVLFPSNIIPVSATMLRRDVLLEAGGFRTRGGAPAEDLDLWVRVLTHGTGVVTPRVGVLYHVHSDQMSGNVARQKDAHLEIIRASRREPWWSERLERSYLGSLRWDLFRLHLRERRYREAAREFRGLAVDPTQVRALPRVWVTRSRARRRSHQFSTEGRLRIIDLRRTGLLRGLISAVARPPGLAITDSRLVAGLLRRFGVATSVDGGSPEVPADEVHCDR
jgi:glycosyltransferase involved in cell wall biosynthesis